MTGKAMIRELQQTLAKAADAQIAEVVSLVDAMADRGAADALLAPLRGRLQQIRPQRRVGLTRLLFIPADAIIVPAPQWRRAGPTIPRSILACLAAQIRTRLGPLGDTVDKELRASPGDDPRRLLQAGHTIWPLAADILASAAMPGDWCAATGLTAADHAAITAPLAVVLHQASTLETLTQQAARGPDGLAMAIVACLKAALTQAQAYAQTHAQSYAQSHAQPAGTAAGARALGMILAILLARLPEADPVIVAAGDLAVQMANPALREAGDAAIDFVLNTVEAGQDSQADLTSTARELSRLAALLDTLDRPGPTNRPGCKARVAQLRRATDLACRARFETEAGTRLRAGAQIAGDAEVAAIETAALDLRRFEAAGRMFGGGPHYDRMLKQTTQALLQSAPPGTSTMDLARFVEILQGPEAALELLAGGR